MDDNKKPAISMFDATYCMLSTATVLIIIKAIGVETLSWWLFPFIVLAPVFVDLALNAVLFVVALFKTIKLKIQNRARNKKKPPVKF